MSAEPALPLEIPANVAPEGLLRLDPDAARVGEDTFEKSQPAPEFVVDDLLPNDVCGLIGAGGTSKTTLALNIATMVVLGRDCLGFRVNRPGGVLVISAEDPLDRIRFRLHKLAWDAQLGREDRTRLAYGICVEDFSDRDAKLVRLDPAGNLTETEFVDAIIDAYAPLNLSLVILDPLVSFGPGERLVNDGEQAVIRAARRIRRALNCPVLFLVHTGKANARDGATDQYSFRGGSALADGMRAVYVLQRFEKATLPEGIDPQDAADGNVFQLHRAKCTDAKPWRDPLWMLRRGFRLDAVDVRQPSAEDRRKGEIDKLVTFLRAETKAGTRHTRNTLDRARDRLEMQRNQIRDVIDRALDSRKVIERDLPEEERKGGRKTYLEAMP
jgi:RecA-family ATPase